MALSIAEWAEVRRLYESSDLAVADIAQRFAISTAALHKKATAEGWPKRSATRARPANYRRPSVPRPSQREMLVNRLVRLVERNLALMEKHMDNDDGTASASDRERATRTVSTLIRTIEKVTELSPGSAASSPSDAGSRGGNTCANTGLGSQRGAGQADGTADLRRELAERLYRMWGGAKS